MIQAWILGKKNLEILKIQCQTKSPRNEEKSWTEREIESTGGQLNCPQRHYTRSVFISSLVVHPFGASSFVNVAIKIGLKEDV